MTDAQKNYVISMTPEERLTVLGRIFFHKLPDYNRDLTHMTLCFDEKNIHRQIISLLYNGYDSTQKLIELKLEDGMKLNEGMKE